MINRRSGECAAPGCGVRVAAGAGEAVKVDGEWQVRCADHSVGATVVERDRVVLACAGAGARETEVRAGDGSRGDLSARHAPAPSPVRAESARRYTLLSGYEASRQQATVFDHFRSGFGSRLVVAVAGSGKTTTMKNAVRFLPDSLSVQMLAFNVKAADQLSAAIDELREAAKTEGSGKTYPKVRAGTFHSVAFRYVSDRLKSLGVKAREPDDGKLRKILRARLGSDPRTVDYLREYGGFAAKLVGLAKGEGLGTSIAPNVADDGPWLALVEHHGISLDTLDGSIEEGVSLAKRLLRWSNEEAERGWIDYDDMLYLVVLWRLTVFPNAVLIVDEAQDVNPIRLALMKMLLRDGGRLYAVGDPNQSIYGFTGAMPDAMDRIARAFRATPLPLSVSYRCAASVVERARTWVDGIEAAPGAPEGRVLDDVPLADALDVLGPDDAVLCRMTRPLVSLAYKLIARGRACRVLGREIGDGLVDLVEAQRAKGIARLVEKLAEYEARERAGFLARGEEAKADAVTDKVGCVLAIVGALAGEERTVPGLIRRIQATFVADGEDEGVLTLATAHKAKGLEWPNVAILLPKTMPLESACRQDWQIAQESNLCYVAATRAKDTLIYVADGDERVDGPSDADQPRRLYERTNR